MNASLLPARIRRRVRSLALRRTRRQLVVFVGSTTLNVNSREIGPPVGAKGPALNTLEFGGPAAGGSKVCAANGADAVAIGAQCPRLEHLVKDLAAEVRVRAILVPRHTSNGAITVGLQNGTPNERKLLVQRIEPPLVHELPTAAKSALASADIVIVGPLPYSDASMELLRFAARHGRFRALIPHPSLLEQGNLREVFKPFDLVVMNRHEASNLDEEAKGDIAKLASCMRNLVPLHTSFVLTDGPRPGFAFIDRRWHLIRPILVTSVASDTGCGDCFTTALATALSRHICPAEAVAYAVQSAHAHMIEAPIRPVV